MRQLNSSGSGQNSVPKQVSINFSFTANGASAISQATIKGLNAVASVTYNTTGVYDVVFHDTYDDFICFKPAAIAISSDGDWTVSSAQWTAATKTLTIRTRSGGSAADVTAGATIGGEAVFKRTKLTY